MQTPLIQVTKKQKHADTTYIFKKLGAQVGYPAPKRGRGLRVKVRIRVGIGVGLG